MKGREVSLPSPDKEAIVKRYVPSECCYYCQRVPDCKVREKVQDQGKESCPRFEWGYTLDELQMAGVEIFEAVDAYGIALGGLLQFS